MEFAPVEQPAEDIGDLLFDNAGPVVLNPDAETIVCHLLNTYFQVGQDA